MDERARELAAVHHAGAKGQEAGKDSRDGRVRPAARGLRPTLWRRAYCRRDAFNPGRQALFAIDHSAHRARAIGAQRLAASAAIRSGDSFWMVDAIHATLLPVSRTFAQETVNNWRFILSGEK